MCIEFIIKNGEASIGQIPLNISSKIASDRVVLKQTLAGANPKVEKLTHPAELEILLRRILHKLLGIADINFSETFFALGGDSILSLRLVALLQAEGLSVKPRDIFASANLRELAEKITKNSLLKDKDVIEDGEIILMAPMQKWFFSKKFLKFNHFNQALLLSFADEILIDAPLLQQIFSEIIARHEVISFRFRQDGDEWQQYYCRCPKIDYSFPITVYDFNEVKTDQQDNYLQKWADELQSTLDITVGPLARAGLLKNHRDGKTYLLLVLHHLICDSVSWQILLDEIEQTYFHITEGRGSNFISSGIYKSWASYFYNFAPDFENELAYWNDVAAQARSIQPSQADSSLIADIRCYQFAISFVQTRDLYALATKQAAITMNDLLICLLLLAFYHWDNRCELLMHVESHGREINSSDIDVSKTIGWFTCLYPLYLTLPREFLDQGSDFCPLLNNIKAQISAVNAHIKSYMYLQYLQRDDPGGNDLKILENLPIVFNYLGRFTEASSSKFYKIANKDIGCNIALANSATHFLEISIAEISGVLQISFYYSKKHFNLIQIENLANCYRKSLHNALNFFNNN